MIPALSFNLCAHGCGALRSSFELCRTWKSQDAVGGSPSYSRPSKPGSLSHWKDRPLWQSPGSKAPLPVFTLTLRGHILNPPKDCHPMFHTSAFNQHPAEARCQYPLLAGLPVSRSDSPAGRSLLGLRRRAFSHKDSAPLQAEGPAVSASPGCSWMEPGTGSGCGWWRPGGASWPCFSAAFLVPCGWFSFIASMGPSSRPQTHGTVPFSILLFKPTHCPSPLYVSSPFLPWTVSEPDSLPGPLLDTGGYRHIFKADCQELGPDSPHWTC